MVWTGLATACKKLRVKTTVRLDVTWRQKTQNVLDNNVDCSYTLCANNNNNASVLLLTIVDRKFLLHAVRWWRVHTIHFIRLLNETLKFTKILISCSSNTHSLFLSITRKNTHNTSLRKRKPMLWGPPVNKAFESNVKIHCNSVIHTRDCEVST